MKRIHSTARARRNGRAGLKMLISVLSVGVLSSAAIAGVPVNWNGGTGVWSDAFNWDFGLIPDNGGLTYDVAIGSFSDDVSLDMSATVDTLTSSGTLRLLDGRSLTLAQPGGLTNNGTLSINHGGTSGIFGTFTNNAFTWIENGTLQLDTGIGNNGTIWMGNLGSGGSTARLDLQGDVALSGGGEIYFVPIGLSATQRPTISVASNTTFSNGAGHRIHGGAGTITGAGTFVNAGEVAAEIPLRELRIETANLVNTGLLQSNFGDLAVNVPDWINSGIVRAANGGTSSLAGTTLVNATGSTIEALGGATLNVSTAVTNRGTLRAGAGGLINVTNGFFSNRPSGQILAHAGTVRYDTTFVDNFSLVDVDQGALEFVNGADFFGGAVQVSNNGRIRSRTGTTVFNPASLTVGPTGRIIAIDDGTGATTMNIDGITNAGEIVAQSDVGNTATINLSGTIHDQGGAYRAVGGDLNVSGAQLDSTGIMMVEARQGGDVRFTDVDWFVPDLTAKLTGSGGSIQFDNVRTFVDPSFTLAWTATNSSFIVQGGTEMTVNTGSAVPQGAVLRVNGTGTHLTMPDLATAGAGSSIELQPGGVLTVNPMATDGSVAFTGGTFDGSLTLNSGASISATSATSFITGSVNMLSGSQLSVTNASSRLDVNGASLTNAAGATISLRTNTTALAGSATLTNSGLIEGGTISTNNTNTLALPLVNTATGVVRAHQFTTETGATFRLTSPTIDNQGLFEANEATNLRITNSVVNNTGSFEIANDRVLTFENTMVDGVGGSLSLDGNNTRLDVISGSNVSFDSFALTNDANVTVNGTNSTLNLPAVVTTGSGSVFTVVSGGTMNMPGLNLEGTLNAQGGTINSPIAVGPAGFINAPSSATTTDINGNVTTSPGSLVRVQNGTSRVNVNGDFTNVDGATIQINTTSTALGGAGSTLFNDGFLEGGASGTNSTTVITPDIVNGATGHILARQFSHTGTTFRLDSGSIVNDGVMEATDAHLRFNGSNIQHNGQLLVNGNVDLLFENGATLVSTPGAGADLDGDNARIWALTGANVALDHLNLQNGANVVVEDGGTVFSSATPWTLGPNSDFLLRDTGTLDGAEMTIDAGLMRIQDSTVNAPVRVTNGGLLRTNTTFDITTFNNTVTIDDGATVSLQHDGYEFQGTGTFVNAGLIEGGGFGNSDFTIIRNDVENQATGVIRAPQFGGATGTRLDLFGNVTNAGLIEGDSQRMLLRTGTITNTGMVSAINGGTLEIQEGAVLTGSGAASVDGNASLLEIQAGGSASFSGITVANGGDVTVENANSFLNSDTPWSLGLDSVLRVRDTATLSGGEVTLDGATMFIETATIDAPIVVGNGGVIDTNLNSATTTFNGDLTVEAGGLVVMNNLNTSFNGAGRITNSGLIQAGINSTSTYTMTIDNDVDNLAGGVVKAFQNGSGANDTLQLRGAITNAGTLEADFNRLLVNATTVTNSGAAELAARNGGNLEFFNSTVTGPSSTISDGAGSLVEVINGSIMDTDSLALTNGGDVTVSGLNSSLTVNNPWSSDAGTEFRLYDNATLNGAEGTINGVLYVYNSTSEAPLTIASGGEVFTAAVDQSTRFNNTVTVESGGTVTIDDRNHVFTGSGTFVNSGLIRGGTTESSARTVNFDNTLVNQAGGVVQAFQNTSFNNDTFRLRGAIDNAGTMVADGGQLLFEGNQVTNSGVLEALNGSNILFQGGAVVTDAGGTFHLGLGGTGTISGSNTSVSASTQVDNGSTLSLNSGELGGPSANIEGLFNVSNAMVTAPVTVASGGEMRAISSAGANMFADVTVESGGTASILVNSGRYQGFGSFTNAGVIQGGAPSNNNTTFIRNDIDNQVGGVVRAFQNGSATGTVFEVSGAVTNAGTLEADAATLRLNGNVVDNQATGSLSAVNGGRVLLQNSFVSGPGSATIDGDTSSLELVTNSLAALDTLTLANGGDAVVTGANVVLSVANGYDIGMNSVVRVGSNAHLDGDGMVTITNGGQLNSQWSTIWPNVEVQSGGGIMANGTGGPATFRGDVNVQSGGDVDIPTNTSVISGTGQFTNSGVIRGGSSASNGVTTMNNDIVNNVDGVVRAYRNGSATGARFDLFGDIDNAGLLEADESRLLIRGGRVTNEGVVSAINGGAVEIQDNAILSGSAKRQVSGRFSNSSQRGLVGGGTAIVDGDTSLLQTQTAGQAAFENLTILNGGDLDVANPNSLLSITNAWGLGDSSFAHVHDSAVLESGGAVTVSGVSAKLELDTAGKANLSSFTIGNGGEIEVEGDGSANPSTLTFANNSSVQAGGLLDVFDFGVVSGAMGTEVAVAGEVRAAGPATFNASLRLQNGGFMQASGSGGTIALNGNMSIESGGVFEVATLSSQAVSGSGTITNAGEIRIGATSTNHTSVLNNDVINQPGGVFRSFLNGAVTGTVAHFLGDLTNDGLVQADGNRFLLRGGVISNAGQMEAINGGALEIQEGAVLTGAGGMTVDGDASLLEIQSAANVTFSSLTLSNGGDVILDDANSTLNIVNPWSAGVGSTLTLQEDGQLTGAAVTLDGATGLFQTGGDANIDSLTMSNGAFLEINGTSGNASLTTANPSSVGVGSELLAHSGAVLNGAEIAAAGTLHVGVLTLNNPVTINNGGNFQATNSGGTATINGDVTVEAGGRAEIYSQSNREVSGSGTFINSGVIEGAAPVNGGLTTLRNNINNLPGGVVRAGQNAGATGTRFNVFGAITNNGIMEADGAELRFDAANVQSDGTIRVVDNVNGSTIRMLNNAQVADLGGSIGSVDGAGSLMEISGNADVAFGSLQLTNGGTATVTGSGSTLTGGFSVDATSTLNVQSSAQLTVTAAGMVNNGLVDVAGATTFTANGAVTTGSTGTLRFANGGTININNSLAMDGTLDMGNNDITVTGDLSFGSGATLQGASGGSFTVSGDVTNASTQDADFDSVALLWELDASDNAGDPLLFEAAGADLGDTLTGLTDNFALDTLLLSGTNEFVTLTDDFDNQSDGPLNDALYVSVLTITDINSRLLLNGVNVYYQVFNGDLASIDTSLGGSFVQLTMALAPEPATALLLIVGAAIARGGRKRRMR